MRQPNVAPCKVTPNPTEHSKPTTRHDVMQELSAVAGVIAASGAVLANNPPEAKAELSVTPSVLTQEGVTKPESIHGAALMLLCYVHLRLCSLSWLS